MFYDFCIIQQDYGDFVVLVELDNEGKAKIPSDISNETLQLYTQNIPSCEVIEFLNSGHMIPDEEQPKDLEEITSFIEKRKDK